MDAQANLRAMVIAGAIAHPQDKEWQSMLKQYVTADIESQRRSDQTEEAKAMAGMVLPILEKILSEGHLPELIRTGIVHKIAGAIGSPAITETVVDAILPDPKVKTTTSELEQETKKSPAECKEEEFVTIPLALNAEGKLEVTLGHNLWYGSGGKKWVHIKLLPSDTHE
jgi:hypothetical protein